MPEDVDISKMLLGLVGIVIASGIETVKVLEEKTGVIKKPEPPPGVKVAEIVPGNVYPIGNMNLNSLFNPDNDDTGSNVTLNESKEGSGNHCTSQLEEGLILSKVIAAAVD